MGRLDFGRPTTPLVPHHLHDDGDPVEGIQYGLPAEPEVQGKPAKREPVDPLGFRW